MAEKLTNSSKDRWIRSNEKVLYKKTIVGILTYLLFGLLVVFGIDTLLALFGGFRIDLGYFQISSISIKTPAIGFLGSFLLFLVVKGKGPEAVLLCGALVVAGVLGEGLLRISNHPLSRLSFDTWYQPSDVLGWTLVPEFRGLGPVGIPIQINSHGFRDIEHTWEKSEGSIRILGLGDSFTFGWGVPLEATFLKQLEEEINARTKMKVETINSGVPGWDLNQYYIFLKNTGVKYSPDIVLLAYFVDDLSDEILEVIPAKKEYEKDSQPEGGIFHRSRLFKFLKSLADQIRYKYRYKSLEHFYSLDARRQKYAKIEHFLVSYGDHGEKRYPHDVLKEHLKRIKRVAHENGSDLVVMYIPDVSLLFHAEFQYINQVLAEITKKLEIPFADMTKIFEDDSKPGTFYLIPKDAHTNIAGHRKMAKALVPLICEMLKQEKRSCERTTE